MYRRLLKLPQQPKRSFFLWGPRQVGKTFLLEHTYPQTPLISLLLSEELAQFKVRPGRLRERMRELNTKFVLIDEVQKVPELLDEIHYLIEKEHMVFGLCGSSARKLKKTHANLLGGRAIRHELFSLTSFELGKEFDLVRFVNRGGLPAVYPDAQYRQLHKAYCSDYLKEEIFDEGLVRKLAPFSQFLEFAALSDTKVLSFETFARDTGVSGPTIRGYFDILNDTLIGRYLPAYVHRPKRKIVTSPKFYFTDLSVVNYFAQRGEIQSRSELFGKAFENWVHHELTAFLSYYERSERLSYWRVHQGPEVDFIVGFMKVAIEAKATSNVHMDHLKGLRELAVCYPELKNRYVISLESSSRRTDDGVTILSVGDFIKRLWSEKLF
ncbi:MAG: ATP-binding protein [Deltaproteobacteria bacterium]|nr:ATP-binding protein [Deltaproteobacteria bacterium]